jgi:hypothetical protein
MVRITKGEAFKQNSDTENIQKFEKYELWLENTNIIEEIDDLNFKIKISKIKKFLLQERIVSLWFLKK